MVHLHECPPIVPGQVCSRGLYSGHGVLYPVGGVESILLPLSVAVVVVYRGAGYSNSEFMLDNAGYLLHADEGYRKMNDRTQNLASPFPPELRTMAFVPRWCILATTVKDNVATHSFFVTVYSYMIAETIKWAGNRDYLMMAALMHDNDETITGDITGPVKSLLVNPDSEDFLTEKTYERMGGLVEAFHELEDKQHPLSLKEVNDIVMAADKLDAVLFLILNKRMGNTLVEPALFGGIKSLEGAWRKLPASKEVLDRTWATVVLPSLQDHRERGARGCAPGVNI